MSKILLPTLVCAVTLLTGVGELNACGDKFLVGVRGGHQLQYMGAIQPTRILVYWHADPDEDSGDDSESVLETSLTDAGHTVALVKDSTSFYQQATGGDFEVILMEVGDAREEQQRLAGVSPDSTILPMLHFPTRREYSAAKKEFGQAVKTPTTIPDLLSKIEKSRPGR